MDQASFGKKTKKMEASTEFPYCVTLTKKSTFDRWRQIGTKHHLPTNEEIACFLLGWYEKKAGVQSVGGICTTCHSLLKLSCLNCGKINALKTSQRDTNPVASIPDRAPQMSTPVAADDNELSVDNDDGDDDDDEDGARGCKVVFQDQKEEQSLSTSSPGMNLRSRRRIEPPSHKSRRASKRKRPTSAQTNSHPEQTSVKSTSQKASSEASEHSNDYFRPVAELSTAVKSEESSYQNVVKVEDATRGESQRDEETVSSTENSDSLVLTERPQHNEETVNSTENSASIKLSERPQNNEETVNSTENSDSLVLTERPQHNEETVNPTENSASIKLSERPQNKEETVNSTENSDSWTLSSEKPRAGRGRPRKYPPIPLECSVCHRKLSTRMAVINHMKKKHPDTKLPESFDAVAPTPRNKPAERRGGVKRERDGGGESNSSEENRHRKMPVTEAVKQLRKAELVSLKCATCGAQFEHKRQMYTHRRLCVSKVCHLCGKSVKQLEMHLKRHSSVRRFPCPNCPKSFLFHNYLEQHMLYHNNERPYCCEICGVRYREKTRLNAHIRTHTGSKPYTCQLCDAAFTRPRGLKDHMRVHTGEKPYRCQVCGRQFSSSGNLAAHRRKVHGLEPQVPNRMTRKLFEADLNQPGLGPPPPPAVRAKDVVPGLNGACDSGEVEAEAVKICAGSEVPPPSGVCLNSSSDGCCAAGERSVDVGVGDTRFDARVTDVGGDVKQFLLVDSNPMVTSALNGAAVPDPVLAGGISIGAGAPVGADVPLGVPHGAVVPDPGAVVPDPGAVVPDLSSGGSIPPPAVFVGGGDVPLGPEDSVRASPVPTTTPDLLVPVSVSVSDCTGADNGASAPVSASVPVHSVSMDTSCGPPVNPSLTSSSSCASAAVVAFAAVGLDL